jgi:hypothetical protein
MFNPPHPGEIIQQNYVKPFGHDSSFLKIRQKRQRPCKQTARPTLTGEAVANTNAEWFAMNFNTQLAAGTTGCSRTHRAPRGTVFAHRPNLGVRHGTGRIVRR